MILKILNSRQKKKLCKKLGLEVTLRKDALSSNEILRKKNDYWLVGRTALETKMQGLEIESLGLKIITNKKPTVAGLQYAFESDMAKDIGKQEGLDLISNGEQKPGLYSYRGKLLLYVRESKP